jgi:hypothetical protein
MHKLPAWIMDDPHALTQILLEGEFTLDDEDTPPSSVIASEETS